MRVHSSFKKQLFFTGILMLGVLSIYAQPITGIWRGKMGSAKIELKLVRKGDSLIGTSYYYDSKTNYRRFSVKGYFDDKNNDVIWWDDVLIEDHGARRTDALLAVADFNCPGEGIMKLDGKSSRKDDDQKDKKELHLVKGDDTPVFPDEWDFLIDNYAFGVSHPEMMDSIERIAFTPALENEIVLNQSKSGTVIIKPKPSELESSPISDPTISGQPTMSNDKQIDVVRTSQPASSGIEKTEPSKPAIRVADIPNAEQTNEERLITRTKILQQVIPVKGDSIELRFYDNAEIDGDSIAVFLNGRLLKEHILLAEQAYIMKIALTDMQADNELVMVAENLGTIPPNTSLMVAIVEDKRYEAHLQSTMGSSALVRLVKP